MKKCTLIKNRVLLLCIGLLFSMSAFAQSFTATGVVVDDAGIPVIGASVLEVGTVNGVSTDVDGNFSLNVAKEGAMLEFSLIGSKTTQQPAAASMNVVLAYDAVLLDNVVVVGFGTQKKANLTGAVSTVDAENFESRPVANATQALQGAVSGLNISSSTGMMGASQSINIRGTATIGTGSSGEPLILIDGMEGDLNSLNPQDIDNISVLKDAAASSIYGSRAPFGVILVTTKSGKKGRVVVNYNNSFRISSMVRNAQTMDSYSAANFMNNANANAGRAVAVGDDQMQRIKDFIDGKITDTTIPNPQDPTTWSDYLGNDNVDYYSAIYKDNTFAQEHTLSLNGGTEKMQVYASINYLDQEGFMGLGNDDGYSRLSTNLRASGDISDVFDFSYNFKYSNVNHFRPTSLSDNGVMQYLRLPPFYPLYDPNDHLHAQLGINLAQSGRNSTTKNVLSQQFRLRAKPLEDWNITAEVNYRYNSDRNTENGNALWRYGVDNNPYKQGAGDTRIYEQFSGVSYLNTNLFTDYTFDINDNHNFKVMAGFQAEKSSLQAFSAKRSGIIVDGIYAIDATSGLSGYGVEVPNAVTGSYNNWATAGFFGRLNYDYKDKYLFEANLRYDGSSRFKAESRWAYFPSFSLGWNVAKEDFWSGIKDKVNMLKLRASYGRLGNQNTTNLYPTYQLLTLGFATGNWLVNSNKTNVTNTPALLNEMLTWEKITTTNIGIDFGALNDRITGTFEWFQRNTLDMIGPAPQLPDILGTAVPKENNTDLRTSGWELSLRYNDVTTGGFGYTVGFQLSDSKTKITNYPNLTNSLARNALSGLAANYYSGQTLGDIYGYTTIGIAKTDGEMKDHMATLPNGGQSALPGGTAPWTAGDIMYKDLNGDGKIDAGSGTVGDTGDLTVIGNNTPRYSFGIDLSADYKGFDFRAFFQGVMKRDFATGSGSFFGYGQGLQYSLVPHLDYFRDENSTGTEVFGLNMDSYYPRPVIGNAKNAQIQTRYLQDASYIRLKNVQLGYTFNKKLIEKIRLSNLRVYVSGENLWTGTKLAKMYDPELVSSTTWGITYPLTKVISFGLSVNF